MNSIARTSDKPHAVCVPFPCQGHVNPMLKLAKLLHFNNFHITFVNTEHIHQRLLNSRGPNACQGLPDFQFMTIPDGLPPSDSTQDVPAVSDSMSMHCLAPFLELLSRVNSNHDSPPVSCIVSDGGMSFTLDAADQLGIPEVLFWTPSACGLLCYAHYHLLLEKGLTPLKDASYLTNGYLDSTIDWIPGMKNIRLKDLPSYCWTTDRNDVMFNFIVREINRTRRASAVVLNTFNAFEEHALNALSLIFPPVYTIGPLHLLVDQIPSRDLDDISSNLWKEQPECIQWLDSKQPNSVVYINFGSLTVITAEQMTELAWGLANSKKCFLWIVRPDIVAGEKATLPSEFLSQTKDRGMLASWCRQEEILKHRAIGGFLSHMGWNSTLESVCSGVPMICWPSFAEQQTNCWFACGEWGIGMEMERDVNRDDVEKLVREVMDGEKGKAMKNKAMEWKTKADEATKAGGSSVRNLEELVRLLVVK